MADDKFDFFDAIKSDVSGGSAGGGGSGGGGGGRCPNCGQAVSKGAVICINCGFNQQQGAQLATTRGGGGLDPMVKLAIGGGAIVALLVLVLAFVMMSGGGGEPEPAIKPMASAAPTPSPTTPATPDAAGPTPTGPTVQEIAARQAERKAREAEAAAAAQTTEQEQAEMAAKAEADRLAAAEAERKAQEEAAKKAAMEAKLALEQKFNDDVAASMQKAREYLVAQFDTASGTFKGKYQNEVGQTALATYALLKAGHDPNDPLIEQATGVMLKYAHGKPGQDSRGTYNCGLVMLALDQLREVRAHEEREATGATESATARRQRLMMKGAMRKLAVGLNNNQQAGKSFSYGGGAQKGGHDMSIHQYAILGMWAAYRSGVKLVPGFWHQQVKYLIGQQFPDGSFSYKPDRPANTTMTTAGVGSLAICYLMLNDNRFERQSVVQSPGDDPGVIEAVPVSDLEKAIHRGFEYLGDKGIGGKPYFNYGLERACALTKTTTVGGKDWYRDIAQNLVRQQLPDGSWRGPRDLTCDTAWNLLFLARGTEKLFEDPIYEQPTDEGGPTIGDGQNVDVIEDDPDRAADDGSAPAPAGEPTPGATQGPAAPPVPGSPLGPSLNPGTGAGAAPGGTLRSAKELVPDSLRRED